MSTSTIVDVADFDAKNGILMGGSLAMDVTKAIGNLMDMSSVQVQHMMATMPSEQQQLFSSYFTLTEEQIRSLPQHIQDKIHVLKKEWIGTSTGKKEKEKRPCMTCGQPAVRGANGARREWECETCLAVHGKCVDCGEQLLGKVKGRGSHHCLGKVKTVDAATELNRVVQEYEKSHSKERVDCMDDDCLVCSKTEKKVETTEQILDRFAQRLEGVERRWEALDNWMPRVKKLEDRVFMSVITTRDLDDPVEITPELQMIIDQVKREIIEELQTTKKKKPKKSPKHLQCKRCTKWLYKKGTGRCTCGMSYAQLEAKTEEEKDFIVVDETTSQEKTPAAHEVERWEKEKRLRDEICKGCKGLGVGEYMNGRQVCHVCKGTGTGRIVPNPSHPGKMQVKSFKEIIQEKKEKQQQSKSILTEEEHNMFDSEAESEAEPEAKFEPNVKRSAECVTELLSSAKVKELMDKEWDAFYKSPSSVEKKMFEKKRKIWKMALETAEKREAEQEAKRQKIEWELPKTVLRGREGGEQAPKHKPNPAWNYAKLPKTPPLPASPTESEKETIREEEWIRGGSMCAGGTPGFYDNATHHNGYW